MIKETNLRYKGACEWRSLPEDVFFFSLLCGAKLTLFHCASVPFFFFSYGSLTACILQFWKADMLPGNKNRWKTMRVVVAVVTELTETAENASMIRFPMGSICLCSAPAEKQKQLGAAYRHHVLGVLHSEHIFSSFNKVSRPILYRCNQTKRGKRATV